MFLKIDLFADCDQFPEFLDLSTPREATIFGRLINGVGGLEKYADMKTGKINYDKCLIEGIYGRESDECGNYPDYANVYINLRCDRMTWD